MTYTIKKELQIFCNLRSIRIFAVTVSAALPIRTANQGGTFAFTSYEKYSKAPLDYCQILSLLKSRGLLIKDKDIAQLKGCTP